MKALVTGGAGFIGGHIARRLSSEHQVRVFDNLSSGKLQNLEGVDAELVRGDVRDLDALTEACRGVEAIFHLAAQISVAASMEDPAETVAVNTQGVLNVLEAAKRQKVGALVFSSSAAIYGDDPTLPKREAMVPSPKSPYAVSKLDGEYYLQVFARDYGIRAVSLRYFNVFGPRQDPKSQYAAAIPAFISRALAGEPITIYGDGGQTRDFVFVEDVARANLMAAGVLPGTGTGLPDDSPVFNVGGGTAISILELAQKIVRMAGSSSRIGHGPERPGDVRHSRADVSRIRDALGFRAETALDEGLERTVAYFRDLV